MADEKKGDSKEEKKGGADGFEIVMMWLILGAIAYGLLTNVSGWLRGDKDFGESSFGQFLYERFGIDLGQRGVGQQTIKGGIPVDINGDGIVDGYTIEGRRGLVGIDRDGDGIIDEYVDMNEARQQTIWKRFWADPSWSNAWRIIQTTGWLWAIVVWGQLILYGFSAIMLAIGVYIARNSRKLEKSLPKPEITNPLAVLVLKEKGHHIPSEDDDITKRWKSIQAKIGGDIADGWKTAILEADIMLDELLDINGYRGDTIGDKLKAVDPADFLTLNQAWEAHKIRNAIAHEGEGFILTSREARRVIGLYEAVFKEFDLI